MKKNIKIIGNIKKPKITWLILASVIGLIGTLFLVFSKAASFSIELETELGNLSNNATVKSDSSSSNGKYIQFGQSTPPPNQGSVPPISQVGPRGQLTNATCGALAPGTYSNLNCTNKIELQPTGNYKFIDVKTPTIQGLYGSALSLRSGTVELDHVDSGGLWFESGGQNGWTIKFSKIYGGMYQAVRPKGNGSITITDSWLLSDGTPPAETHTEVMQLLDGSDGLFERVAFSRQPVNNNTVTAVLTIAELNGGNSTQFIDCIVGYWNGSNWSLGGGNYAVYPGNSHWYRPIIYSSQVSAWYAQKPPPILVNPTYMY